MLCHITVIGEMVPVSLKTMFLVTSFYLQFQGNLRARCWICVTLERIATPVFGVGMGGEKGHMEVGCYALKKKIKYANVKSATLVVSIQNMVSNLSCVSEM